MVELKHLSAGYGGTEVLHQISLTFPPGQVTALIGPNGCGKSTLLKTIPRLLEPSGGAVSLQGRPAEDYSPRELARQVAYLPQSRPVPNISARKMVLHGRFPYLSYPRRYRREDWERAEAALQAMGAGDLGERMLPQLSGGQRQKIYLAMALCQDTPNILMDEPTTYLDMACQLEVMETARRLAAEGRTVVLVLHDLSLALTCAHRIALMEEGRMVSTGSPEEILASGRLEEVMGVRMGRTELPDGPRYYLLGRT